MRELFRWYFVAFYGIGLVVLTLTFLAGVFQQRSIARRSIGVWIYAATVVFPLGWLLPPALMLLKLGDLPRQSHPIQLAGLVLSLYACVVIIWAQAALGRCFTPYVVVFKDHALVTHGPFRFVRHPIYSGGLALFLGSGLATLNIYLVALWPILVMAFWIYARLEERLLREKFGASYELYAQHAGLLIPRFGGRSTRSSER